jgi:hypothetical protein
MGVSSAARAPNLALVLSIPACFGAAGSSHGGRGAQARRPLGAGASLAAGRWGPEGAIEHGSPRTPTPPLRRASRGWSSRSILPRGRWLGPLRQEEALPTFRRLRDLGAFTLDARPTTRTGHVPNHVTGLTGRPGTAVPGLRRTPTRLHRERNPRTRETRPQAGNPALGESQMCVGATIAAIAPASSPASEVRARPAELRRGPRRPERGGKDDGRGKRNRFVVMEVALIEVAAADRRRGRCDLSRATHRFDTPLGTGPGGGPRLAPGWTRSPALGACWTARRHGGLEEWGVVLTAPMAGGYDHMDAANPPLRDPVLGDRSRDPRRQGLYSLLAGRRVDPGDERPSYEAAISPCATAMRPAWRRAPGAPPVLGSLCGPPSRGLRWEPLPGARALHCRWKFSSGATTGWAPSADFRRRVIQRAADLCIVPHSFTRSPDLDFEPLVPPARGGGRGWPPTLLPDIRQRKGLPAAGRRGRSGGAGRGGRIGCRCLVRGPGGET